MWSRKYPESHFMPMTLALVITGVTMTHAQQIFPTNVCTQYFQYIQSGGWYGELTLPQLSPGKNRLDLSFSQRGIHSQSAVGQLSPFPNKAALRNSIDNQSEVKFRLALQLEGSLPKLTLFALNGHDICKDHEYDGEQTYFNRYFEIDHGSRTLFGSSWSSNSFGQYSDVYVNTQLHTFDGLGNQRPVERPIPNDRTNNVGFAPVCQSCLPEIAPAPPLPSRPLLPNYPTATLAPTQFSYINQMQPTPTPKPTLPPTTIDSVSSICGQEGKYSTFIALGEEFTRGRFPWLAAIYHKVGRTFGFKCGGTLVSHRMVITAAHCVDRVESNAVIAGLGRHDLDEYIEKDALMMNIEQIRKHPDYTTIREADADIALLTLKTAIKFTEYISPICLWEDTLAATSTAQMSGSVAGWGLDENGKFKSLPSVIDANIATEVECASEWKMKNQLSKRTLCAGNLDGTGPCAGDSGSGLIMKQNNRWHLRGIVSKGERTQGLNCNFYQYVLYCDLSKHMDWIRQHLL